MVAAELKLRFNEKAVDTKVTNDASVTPKFPGTPVTIPKSKVEFETNTVFNTSGAILTCIASNEK